MDIEQFRQRALSQGFTEQQVNEYIQQQGLGETTAPEDSGTAVAPRGEPDTPSATGEATPPAGTTVAPEANTTGEPIVEQPMPDAPLSDAQQGRSTAAETTYDPQPDAVIDDGGRHNFSHISDRYMAAGEAGIQEETEEPSRETGDRHAYSDISDRYRSAGEAMRAEYDPADPQPLSNEVRERALAEGFTEEELAVYESRQSEEINPLMLPESVFATPSQEFSYTPEFGSGEYTDEGIGIMPAERVRSLAMELEVDPRTQTGINAIYSKARRDNRQRTERALVRDLETVTNVDRPFLWMRSKFGDAAEQEYEAQRAENVSDIIRLASERGVELEVHNDEFYSRSETGEMIKVEPGFFEDMGAAKYETVGGIGGGMAGWAAGSALARNLNATGPWGRAITMGVAGGAALFGHVAGNQMDYLEAAITVQEDWDAAMAAERAMGSAQMGVLYEVAGLGIGKGIQLGAANYRSMTNAFNKWRDKDTAGAIGYIRQSVGYITEEEGHEILRRWEALNESQMSVLGQTRREMAAIATTQPGGEHIIRRAGTINPSVGAAVAKGPADRAREMRQQIENITGPDTGARVLDDLSNYRTDVQVQYDQIRTMGSDLVPEGYHFEFEPTALEPMIVHQIENLADPTQTNRLMNILDSMSNLSESRSFDDLIELRQTLNQHKFSRAFRSRSNQRAVNSAIDEIDAEINGIMQKQGESGQQWLGDWQRARQDYAEMKELESNFFYRQLQTASHSNTEDRIASALVRFSRGQSGEYEQVIRRLTPDTRERVEGKILDQIVSSHTTGAEGQFQAINFPAVSRDIRDMQMDTPRAARMQEVINDLAEVYRNDVNLVQVSNQVGARSEQGFATTIKGRAKVFATNRLWRFLRSGTPGSEGDAISASLRLSNILKDPLDARTVGNMLEDRRIDQELAAAFRRVQSETARELSEGSTPPAQLYRDNSGRLFFEEGIGRTASGDTIMPHRVVGVGDAQDILGVGEITFPTLTRANRLKLADRGFLAIGFPDGQVLRLHNE